MKKNNVIKRGCNTINAQIIYDEWIKKDGEFVILKKEEFNSMWIIEDLKGKKYAIFSDSIRNPEIMRIIECLYIDNEEI